MPNPHLLCDANRESARAHDPRLSDRLASLQLTEKLVDLPDQLVEHEHRGTRRHRTDRIGVRVFEPANLELSLLLERGSTLTRLGEVNAARSSEVSHLLSCHNIPPKGIHKPHRGTSIRVCRATTQPSQIQH